MNWKVLKPTLPTVCIDIVGPGITAVGYLFNWTMVV